MDVRFLEDEALRGGVTVRLSHETRSKLDLQHVVEVVVDH